MKRLAEFSYRRRRLVVVSWIGLLVGLFVLSGALSGEYRTEFELPGSESQAAFDLLEERGVAERTGFSGQAVFEAENGIDDPAIRQAIESFLADIGSTLEGVQILSPYDPANSYQVAEGGTIAYAELNFSDRDQEQYVEDGDRRLDDGFAIQGGPRRTLGAEHAPRRFWRSAGFIRVSRFAHSTNTVP